MFRRPKVPNDNKKQLSLNFVSLLILFSLISHMQSFLLRKSLGEIKAF